MRVTWRSVPSEGASSRRNYSSSLVPAGGMETRLPVLQTNLTVDDVSKIAGVAAIGSQIRFAVTVYVPQGISPMALLNVSMLPAGFLYNITLILLDDPNGTILTSPRPVSGVGTAVSRGMLSVP